VGATKAEVFENRELRNIFGPKRDDVTRGCGRMHNEEFYDRYPHPILFG
jgi:hypothetical protein